MSPYTVTLTETNDVTVEQKELGIEAARLVHNDEPEFADNPIPDAAGYVQWVMDRAAESYARMYVLS